MVVATRKLGGATLYRINTGNFAVKKLIELNATLCWDAAEKKEEIAAQ